MSSSTHGSRDGSPSGYPTLAAELVALKPDVIVDCHGRLRSSALKARDGHDPDRHDSSATPVGEGLVASLADPGGNITGLTMSGHRDSAASAWSCSAKRPRGYDGRCAGTTTPFCQSAVPEVARQTLEAVAPKLGFSCRSSTCTGGRSPTAFLRYGPDGTGAALVVSEHGRPSRTPQADRRRWR